MAQAWSIVALVLAIISLVVAIMTNTALSAMYLLVFAIFICCYTQAKIFF